MAGQIHRKLLGRFVSSLTFRADSCPMRVHKGRAVAAGILCAIAATVAVWSGPLFAASSALHASGEAPVPTSSSSDTATRSASTSRPPFGSAGYCRTEAVHCWP